MDIATQPVKTSRLALRVAVCAMFFMSGLCYASWASRIPAIKQYMHLSETDLGGLLLAIPIGLMCSLPFIGWVIPKIGSRKLLIISILLYGVLLVSIGAAQNIA